MDPRRFAYRLVHDPETATTVMALIEAEAFLEKDSKHFPYLDAGGTPESQASGERITDLAQFIAAESSAERDRERARDPQTVTVVLADGWELRSGIYDHDSPDARTCGEWVSLHTAEGREYAYWDQSEWQTDPALVMGAIVNAAAGYRPAS
jgi:hypothetical protein